MENEFNARNALRSNCAKMGFSLIEILISLIIISLLVAAFTPIITKKLKASDISIGSFGNGGNVNMTLERQVTKEDCDKYDALFIPASFNGGQRNLCVTKYNMGDNDLPLADSVKKLSAGNTCSDKDMGNCCWQGKTAGTCGSSGNGDGDYSGCNRTVCQFQAANASCASFAPNNENEGKWRLPNKEELNNWGSNLISINNNKGKEGLQLCDYTDATSGLVQCTSGMGLCKGSLTQDCGPHNFWSGTQSGDDTQYYTPRIKQGKFEAMNLAYSAAGSARCVLDSMTVDISELPNGNGIKDPTVNPFYGEPKDQADCDKIVAIFIDKKMSGANRNICVSKYNAGDAGPDGFGPPIPQNFTQYIISIGQTCPYPGYCCWKGKTAGTCGLDGNAGANYSGCNRTVCQWKAANSACREYNAFGATAVGAWRLPTQAEFSVWAQYMDKINNNQGTNGLQLCFESTGKGAVRCTYTTGCPGSTNSYCFPHTLHSSTYGARLRNDALTTEDSGDYTASVRCVYDGITKANNYEEDLSDYDDSNAPKDEPKSQADCDKLTAIFVHKKYIGGMRNLCVSKYNVGDSGPSGSGPAIPSTYASYTMNVGQTCPYPGYCCWKGKTAGTCGITGNAGANYSGCNRTVCQWNVANESCLTWTAGGKTSVGAWRLPTQAELTTMTNYMNIVNNDRGKDGLQLCFEGANNGSVQCTYTEKCLGASRAYCFPHTLHSSTYGVRLRNDAMVTEADNYTASARCVYDGTVRKVEEVTDYDETGAAPDEPKSQADCDKLTAIFIHKKYSGSSRNICVSKYNVGDSGPSGSGPAIPTEYKQYLVSTRTGCSKSGYCCWKGITSGTCGIVGNMGSDYNGCGRVVCQWNIADAACRAYTANGKTQAGYWRLPNSFELTTWANHIDILSKNRGKDGLQLCVENGTAAGHVQCTYNQNCSGAGGAYCFPHTLWSSTSTGSNVYFRLRNTDSESLANTYTASARCVYDGSKAN